MRKKIAVIAKNPLSQNIAKILGYRPGVTESVLRKAGQEICEKIRKQSDGKNKLDVETIMNWMLPDKKDPEKTSIFVGKKIMLFADAIGVKYWELYIPDTYINLEKLPKRKADIIKTILNADNEFLKGVQSLLAVHFEEEAQRVADTYQNLSTLIKGLREGQE